MKEIEKAQLVTDAASILVLDAQALRSTSAIALAIQGLLSQISSEDLERLQPEVELVFSTIKTTQGCIRKAGTAQSLFMEDMKEKFGIGEGKPKNVRKGSVRKKD